VVDTDTHQENDLYQSELIHSLPGFSWWSQHFHSLITSIRTNSHQNQMVTDQ
jgi:hypothetical protein